MEDKMIRVGITHGDINGIGYEVILKTFSDQRMTELCVPIIYGSSKVAAYHRKALDLPAVNINVVSRAEEAGLNRVNIINCVEDDIKVELTQSTPVAGRAAYKALEYWLQLLSINIIFRMPNSIFRVIRNIWNKP